MRPRPFSSLLPVLRLCCLAAALCLPRVASAQAVEGGLAGQLQLADAYLRAAQYDRALRILEDAHAAHPEIGVFYEKLRDTYEAVKRYPEAVALVDRRIQTYGRRVDLLADKARLSHLAGDEAAAARLWEEALAGAGADRNAYRIIQETQFAVRLYDRAIATLEQARKVLGPGAAVEGELGYLYNLDGRPAEAMQAYLRLLEANPRQLSFVRNRLTRFMEQPEAVRASITAAEQAVRAAPLNRAYREVLAWLYMEARAYDKAFETYRAIDRLEQENGRVLFGFAQAAMDEKAYDMALAAYQEILERYPDAPTAPDVLFALGQMHESWAERTAERAADASGAPLATPHYRQALAAYTDYLARYPNGGQAGEALRRIGTLQRDVFHALDAAEEAFRASLRAPANNPGVMDKAELDLGRIALLRGDLDEARIVFTRLLERLRTGDLAEAARYELASLHFYRGEFEAARTLSEALHENTAADVANDAIELQVLLVENPGPDSLSTPLRLFARAHLMARQRHTAGALATLDSLLGAYAAHPLADDARFLRAQTLREAGRFADAAAAFAEVAAMHPASYLADRSLFQYARTLDENLHDRQAAIEAYTRLLTQHPGSLYGAEARARIRALRGDSVS